MDTIVLDHDVDTQAEKLVRVYKERLEFAVVDAQIDSIEEQINIFDANNPTLYRPLLRRLEKPLARHRRRIKQGNVCIPKGVKFPQKMVCGDSVALVVDGQGYSFYARNMYIPVIED